VPAYLFRLCGLNKPHLGAVSQGDVIGSGKLLLFAALRKQPNGTWAIVEPAKGILERTLKRQSETVKGLIQCDYCKWKRYVIPIPFYILQIKIPLLVASSL
jgi:hypothetical protein